MRIKSIIIALGLLYGMILCANVVTAAPVNCSCNCFADTLNATGPDVAECNRLCGAACGSLTGCGFDTSGDCDGNCINYCTNDFVPASDGYIGCEGVCISTCKLNKLIDRIILLVRMIAVISAIIVLTLNGAKWMTSTSPSVRDESFSVIIWVIMGLIILQLTISLVEIIMGGGGHCP